MTFGPRNFANMHKLIRQIDRGRFYPVGNGANRKSMAFVTNLVEATLHLWPEPASGWAVFNYVDKPDLTSRNIVEAIYENLGRRPPRWNLPYRPILAAASLVELAGSLVGRRSAISRQGVEKLAGIESVFPASRIRERGFVPAVSLKEGLREMVDWYRTVPDGHSTPRIPPAEVQVFP
jgi:nucleoside-diphosphate-sugar epimerase